MPIFFFGCLIFFFFIKAFYLKTKIKAFIHTMKNYSRKCILQFYTSLPQLTDLLKKED